MESTVCVKEMTIEKDIVVTRLHLQDPRPVLCICVCERWQLPVTLLLQEIKRGHRLQNISHQILHSNILFTPRIISLVIICYINDNHPKCHPLSWPSQRFRRLWCSPSTLYSGIYKIVPGSKYGFQRMLNSELKAS